MPSAGVPGLALGRHAPGRRLLFALLIAAAVLAPATWVGLSSSLCVSDGSAAYPQQRLAWRNGMIPVNRTYADTGLQQGDRVEAVSGVPLEQWVRGNPSRTVPRREPADRVTYTVVRDRQRTDVTVTLRSYPLASAVGDNLMTAPLPLLLLAVGGFVFWHRPKDTAARLMLALAALLPAYATAWPFGLQVVDVAGGCGVWRYLIGDLASAGVWTVLLHFALIFPEPVGLVARRRWLPWFAYAVPVVLYLGHLALTLPSADSAVSRLEALLLVSGLSALVVPALVAGLMVLSYRRSTDPAIRRPMQWIFASFLLVVVLYLGLGQLPDRYWHGPLLDWQWLVLLMLPIPLAVGAAILRYRLFDIEVILRRSVVYGALTVCLLGVYLGLLVLLGAALEGLQLTNDARVVALIAGGVTALCFGPLRTWLRRSVSRMMYGARDDPYAVVSRIGSLGTASQPQQILAELADGLASALRLAYVELQLRRPDGGRETAARHGDPSGQAAVLPLQQSGETVGQLLLGVGPGQEPFGRADRRLLDAVAHEVSGVAHAVLLAIALQGARERLVRAREEERRRLRLDLHDGVKNTLQGASYLLDAALATGGIEEPTRGQLERVAETIHQARDELDAVVQDLRLSSLDRLGLVNAVREQASLFATPQPGPAGLDRRGLHVELTAEGRLDGLPAAVEVAAFRITVEAISNAARHSNAAACQVRLHGNGEITIEVRDDGRGLPEEIRAGVGLQSMRERAAELGGVCTAETSSTGGTVVRARLPLGGSEPDGGDGVRRIESLPPSADERA